MKVLWLTSWYPSMVNYLDGDFIERHAQTAAIDNDITVIHIVKSNLPAHKKITREEKKYSSRCSAIIYYYPSYIRMGKWFDRLASDYWYTRLHFRAFHEYRRLHGKPHGILVQVGLKAGIPALLFRLFYGVEYILFERWTGFLPEARPNFTELSFVKRWWWHRIIRHSVKLLTVSAYFGRMIQQYHYKKSLAVVPNAVNPYFTRGTATKTVNKFQFIHISNMDYQKNFEDVLIAVSILVKKTDSFHLEVYGPIHPHITQEVHRLQLSEYISFRGEVPHEDIAKAMQASDALVFYSRFETFGNVVIEANACGLPVIVSDHPVFREIVEEGVSGLIVPGEKPALLAASMEWLINNPGYFNSEKISTATHARYSPALISRLFDQEFRSAFPGH